MKPILLTFLALCLSAASVKAQSTEAYLLLGAGKFYQGEPYDLAGNISMRASPHSKHFYLNAGLGVYFSFTDDYFTEFAIGPGYRYAKGPLTIKAGCDVGYMLAITGTGQFFSYMPQASITTKVGRKLAIGLLAKANMPLKTDIDTRFFTAGVLLSF